MFTTYDLKTSRMEDFFGELLDLGLTLNDAWDLMLNSEQGFGILNEDYTYCVHFTGSTSANKALKATDKRYKIHRTIPLPRTRLINLAEFIEDTHINFSVRYEDIFKKMSIQDFYEQTNEVLGNYDDKLYKIYLQ